MVKLDESLLTDLIFQLGVITSQLSCIDGIPINVKIKLSGLNSSILEQIDSLVELESYFTSEDGAMLEHNATQI